MADFFDKQKYPEHWAAVDALFKQVLNHPDYKGNHLARFKPVIDVTTKTNYAAMVPGQNTLLINPAMLDTSIVPLNQFKAVMAHEWWHHLNRESPGLLGLLFPDKDKLKSHECSADQFAAYFADRDALEAFLRNPPKTVHTGEHSFWAPNGTHPTDHQRLSSISIPGIDNVSPAHITFDHECKITDIKSPHDRHIDPAHIKGAQTGQRK